MEWFDRRYEGIDFDRPEWAWGLEGCCGVEEKLFLTLYVVYAVVFFLLHQLYFFKPVRLLTVFLHEFGHASACWISGGSVRKIEVYENEGGVTGYTGGCRILVIPAGYVGAAFWGGTIVFLSGGARLGSTICAGIAIANIADWWWTSIVTESLIWDLDGFGSVCFRLVQTQGGELY
eukprot:scaffold84_cov163-Amphora_coffeaeformis.AAC.12